MKKRFILNDKSNKPARKKIKVSVKDEETEIVKEIQIGEPEIKKEIQIVEPEIIKEVQIGEPEIIILSSEDEIEEKKYHDIKTPRLKKLKVLRKDVKQPKIKNFFPKINDSECYFTAHKKSSMPANQKSGELNISQLLQVSIKEEDVVLTESQLAPISTPECISKMLHLDQGLENIDQLLYCNNQDPEVVKWNMEENLVAVESQPSDDEILEKDKVESLNESTGKRKKKKVICPKYKVVEGSSFAVDAFRYGVITGVTHYFLTHYHADHYIGLTKKFQHPLFLSAITCQLVKKFIGVNEKFLNVVKVNTPFYLMDVKITPMDANHCPGAVLFLFQFPNAKNILHTGDFRANEEMSDLLSDWNCHLDLLYLDTTYLHTKRSFPSQDTSISFLIENVQKYLEANIGEPYVIICGSYLVGKEKIWISIARKFKFKVWMEKERRKALEAICSASDEYLDHLKCLVSDPEDADIHVVNMLQLSYPNLKEYLDLNQDTYTTVLGIVPSGWQNQKYTSGRISLLHVQYSEHSSYDELERFVCATKPVEIISTVPIGVNPNKTADIPREWLQDVKPRKKVIQPILTLPHIEMKADVS